MANEFISAGLSQMKTVPYLAKTNKHVKYIRAFWFCLVSWLILIFGFLFFLIFGGFSLHKGSGIN